MFSIFTELTAPEIPTAQNSPYSASYKHYYDNTDCCVLPIKDLTYTVYLYFHYFRLILQFLNCLILLFDYLFKLRSNIVV